MNVRVIVPCYNEGEIIVKTYERLTEVLAQDSERRQYNYELLFVDDGSKDSTVNYIQDIANKDQHIKFISFSRNFGKESAMLAGYQYSTDCDADQVIAKRNREGEKKPRKLLTRSYYKLINYFVDINLEDGVGDFRLLSNRAVKSIASLEEYNRFSKGLYEWIGYNTKVFTYENVEREEGESKWSFGNLLNYAIDGLISFNNKPLRAVIYLGLFVSLISLLYIIYIFCGILIDGIDTPGYFSTIAAILLLGGIQLISIGIIGEYIGRIYYEVKRRPKYIVLATNITDKSKDDAQMDAGYTQDLEETARRQSNKATIDNK